MKKKCIIFANCQSSLIAEYLSKSSHFSQEFVIQKYPVHLLMERKSIIPPQILKQAKLFIFQPVKNTHGNLSSDFILQQLPDNCRCISFPSLYFGGYFPQYCKNPVNKKIKPNYPFGIIPHGDKNIISLLAEDKSVAEITKILSNPDFYSAEYLSTNLYNTLAELENRESQLSIKVSNFLRQHYQKYYLFHTQNHPTDIVGIYIVNQILKLLNFPDLGDPLSFKSPTRGILDNFQIPLYPSVIKHLELTFANNTTFYRHGSFCTNQMTFSRYIAEYIYLHLSTKSADFHEFKSIDLVKKNQLSQATINLKQAITLKSDNATYYGELGSILKKQSKLDDAALVYQKAIDFSPDWEDFYQSLGEILSKKKNLSGAISVYQKALKLNPCNGELYRLIGDLFFEKNKLEEARTYYQKAIKLEPNIAFYYRCLGDVFKKQHDLNLAITNYQKAIELSPKTAYFYVRLISSLAKQNKFDEAIKYCRQGIDLNPNNPILHSTLGNIQLQKGNIDQAFASYQQAIRLNPQQMKNIFPRISTVIKDKTSASVYNCEPQTVI
jgi:tetratricopeptide (TPR) repeat protein